LNQDRGHDLTFTPEDLSKMIAFYKSDRFQWSFHGERLARYFETGEMKKPCSCGFNYFFVRSTGELYLCPLINVALGNIREKPIEELFLSDQADRVRRKIGRFPDCKQCTEPGLERYALAFEGLTYLSLLFRMGRSKFFQLHRHIGLDKYIN
jgi:MoaA/NifB/PqqE/SkfB family radical SAM enzyme